MSDTALASATDPRLLRALNAVCPYYTMFPLDFPLARLAGASTGDWVLDPFCGRGSTNFAARLLGLPSVGVDANPVAAAIAQAKAVSTTPSWMVATCTEILRSAEEPEDLPQGDFWKRAFHQSTLFQLCKLREALLKNCRSPTRKALRALLLGLLHGPKIKARLKSYCSNQMPRTYASKPDYALRFWRGHRMQPPKVDVLDLVTRKAVHYFGHLPPSVDARVVVGDSRRLKIRKLLPRSERAGWVITSPPYYGMRTYVPDQWLRYWFLGGPAKVVYRVSRQLKHHSPGVFARELGTVWKNVACACKTDARLVVRFGSIPDRDQDARDILRESFRVADAGWRITTVRSAGAADHGRRQAGQFGLADSSPIEEFDFYARLET